MAQTLTSLLDFGTIAIAVEILEVVGSTPRDADAVMIVTKDAAVGTIGGGTLEWTAIEHARDMMDGRSDRSQLSLPLGPLLGQCCGGHVVVGFQPADQSYANQLARRERTAAERHSPLMVFGAGHVARALAQALLPLPVAATFVDTREGEIERLPPGAKGSLVEDPLDSLAGAEAGTSFLIMTHSHIQDFILLEAALLRSDAPYLGMIGSATKRASFMGWMGRERGSRPLKDSFICPVGGAAVRDKRPAVIAAMVVAEFLTKVHARGAAAADAAVEGVVGVAHEG